MTLLYRRCLHFLYTILNSHSFFYFSVSQKHPRFRLAILIYNLEMWRSNCNMKTAAWNYDDLWLGSAFSNGVFNAAQMGTTRHWVFDYGMWVCHGGSPHGSFTIGFQGSMRWHGWVCPNGGCWDSQYVSRWHPTLDWRRRPWTRVTFMSFLGYRVHNMKHHSGMSISDTDGASLVAVVDYITGLCPPYKSTQGLLSFNSRWRHYLGGWHP